jgi:hypothetical protein
MANVSVFVGSSSEALNYAKAARVALEEDSTANNRQNDPTIDVTIWNEEFFLQGSTYIETLVNALPRFDFAVFVLTPDDLIGRREVSSMGPRDNVIFELGLFMGHLGRARTFALVQENTVVTARYRPRIDGNDRAAVGAACDHILKVIRELGVSDRKAGQRLTEMTYRQDAMESQVNVLLLLAKGLITDPEKNHMRGLAHEGSFDVWFHNDMMAELKHLDALRYVLPNQGRGLNDIYERDGKAEKFDLKQYVYITDTGREYLRLLDQLSSSDQ